MTFVGKHPKMEQVALQFGGRSRAKAAVWLLAARLVQVFHNGAVML